MKLMNMLKLTGITLALLCMSAMAADGPQTESPDPARLAPADSAFYIRINQLARLRAEMEKDPLGQYLRKHAAASEQSPEWLAVQKKLGLDSAGIIDTYFGQVVAILGRSGQSSEGMVISRVGVNDGAILPGKLDLAPLKVQGPFALYKSKDGKAVVGIGEGWALMSDARAASFVQQVAGLAGGSSDKTLAEDAQFKSWMAGLPAGNVGMFFARNPINQELHGVTAIQTGRDLTLHYAGRSKAWAQPIGKLKLGHGAADFGPLPADHVVAAVSLHGWEGFGHQGGHPLDQLFAPRSFLKDIEPKLAPPVVLFAGIIDGKELTPDPGLAVPVLGASIRMIDPAVGSEMDAVIGKGVLLLNAFLNGQGLPPCELTATKGKLGDYQVVDFGGLLVKLTGQQQISGLGRLAFGRVGDHWMICTQERFLTKCQSAAKGETPIVKSLSGQEGEPTGRPILTAMVNAAKLRETILCLTDYQKRFDLQKNVAPDARQALERQTAIAAGLLEFFKDVDLGVWTQGEDGLRAVVHIRRK